MQKIIIGLLAVISGIGIYIISKKKSQNKKFKVLNFEILKFSDIIKLAKEFHTEHVLKDEKILVLLKSNINTEYFLTIFDKEKSEVINDYTYMIKCQEIDESLKLALGEKEMLILDN